MTTLIEHLESFNRKERFILLEEALGEATFILDEGFRGRLSEAIRVDVPQNAFVAMDYHLDWIQMALHLADNPVRPSLIPNPGKELFEANQQDVDLLVAFEADATTHLVLIEAKVESGWSNEQLCSKAKRLGRVFGPEGKRYAFAKPHFVLTSPRESKGVRPDAWPEWMVPDDKPIWMKLPRPEGLLEVTRCTRGGKVSESGGYLRIDSVPQDS